MGLLGRAWVSSLPKFFLGKYFHFWKLPPLFCIKSSDNVYYPIFLLKNGFHFFIWKMVENGIKPVVSGEEHTFFVDNFSVGKARERVFSLTYPQPFSIYPQAHQLNLSTALEPAHSPQRQYHTSNLVISCIVPHDTTLTTLRVSIIKQHNTTTRKQYNNTTTHKRTRYS